MIFLLFCFGVCGGECSQFELLFSVNRLELDIYPFILIFFSFWMNVVLLKFIEVIKRDLGGICIGVGSRNPSVVYGSRILNNACKQRAFLMFQKTCL